MRAVGHSTVTSQDSAAADLALLDGGRPEGGHADVMFMFEHPGWVRVPSRYMRVMRAGDSHEVVEAHVLDSGGGVICTGGRVDGFCTRADLAARLPTSLAGALSAIGTVRRFRNASLWDAIVTAILRQVIRAPQSRDMYRRFCRAHGEALTSVVDGHCLWLIPAPLMVLHLADEDFSELGMAFKVPALRAAAEAFLERHEIWLRSTPDELLSELCAVRGIGIWTSKAAIADWTNDWARYPYEDLAVRTWARRAAPDYEWPESELEFGRLWQELGQDQLSELTLLTLAWGSKRGVIG